MFDNTVMIVSSDNGANPENGGSNFPLRGSKGYLFEGGVRVPAFVHAPNHIPLEMQGSTYLGMFHIVDWLPTIVEGIMQEEIDTNLVGQNRIAPMNRRKFRNLRSKAHVATPHQNSNHR